MNKLILLLAIILMILAFSRNVILYYYKKNNRLSEIELHYIFQNHQTFIILALALLIVYGFMVTPNYYYVLTLSTYAIAIISDFYSEKYTKLVLVRQGFAIISIFFALFALVL